MSRLARSVVVSVVALVCGVAISAQAQSDVAAAPAATPPVKPCAVDASVTPQERVIRIHECSSLGAQRIKPWHMTLAVTLFDDEGKNPQSATIEYSQDTGNDRTVYTSDARQYTVENTPSGSYYSDPAQDMPYFARRILDDVLDPGPNGAAVADTHPESRSIKLGQVPMDCVMLSQIPRPDGPTSAVSQPPLGLFPTYCMTARSAELRVTVESGNIQVLRDGIGIFLGRSVATTLSVVQSGVVRARAKLTTISTFTPEPATFSREGLTLLPDTDAALISGGMIAGNILKKVTPMYPVSARERHATGTVVLHAIIGKDGHVHQLTPVSLPDADLAVAAITAVEQWIYSPYLLNGIPTDVDTMVTVNFNMGH